MTKLYLLNLLLCLTLLSCGQNQTSDKIPVKRDAAGINDTILNKSLLIDTSKIAILPADTTFTWTFKNAKPLQLTNQDLQTIDNLLNACINANNKQDTAKKFYEFINLKNYKRQYIPFINENGERSVYINCFCLPDYPDEFAYWKKSLVRVDDGGSCFFQLIINLTSKQYGQLMINGYA